MTEFWMKTVKDYPDAEPNEIIFADLKDSLSQAKAGLTGNFFRFPIFFGVDFLFGSIATLIIVRIYGVWWGTAAALIASSYTYFLWEHPFGIIIFTCETLFVGLFLRRHNQNILLLDGMFWLLAGMPMVVIIYSTFLSVDMTQILLLMFKQSINGIFNALIVNLLFLGLSLQNRTGVQRVRATLSLRNILLNLLVAFVFFPSLTLMMLDSQQAVQEIETRIQTNLQILSVDIATEVERWYQQYLGSAKELAQFVADLETTSESKYKARPEIYAPI